MIAKLKGLMYLSATLLFVFILAVGSTLHYKGKYKQLIGEVGAKEEKLLQATTAVEQCRKDMALASKLSVELSRKDGESEETYKKYSQLVKQAGGAVRNKQETKGEENYADVGDMLPPDIVRLLSEAYDSLYPQREEDTRELLQGNLSAN